MFDDVGWSAGRGFGRVVDVHMLGTSDAFSKARTMVMADILSFDHDKVMRRQMRALDISR